MHTNHSTWHTYATRQQHIPFGQPPGCIPAHPMASRGHTGLGGGPAGGVPSSDGTVLPPKGSTLPFIDDILRLVDFFIVIRRIESLVAWTTTSVLINVPFLRARTKTWLTRSATLVILIISWPKETGRWPYEVIRAGEVAPRGQTGRGGDPTRSYGPGRWPCEVTRAWEVAL